MSVLALELVLAGLVPDADVRSAVAGDLTEDYHDIVARRGTVRGAWWLARQLALSAPYLASLGAGAFPGWPARSVLALYGRFAVIAGAGVGVAELAIALSTRAAPFVVVMVAAPAAAVAGFAVARTSR